MGGIGGRGRIKVASASTPSSNEPAKDLILVHTVELKPMIIAHFSGSMKSSGLSDVAFASVHSEKAHLEKLMMMMHKSQEMTVFSGCQKRTSAIKSDGRLQI